MQINMKIYGKYDHAGVHDNEPNPVPNFYIEDKQVYFYDVEKNTEAMMTDK